MLEPTPRLTEADTSQRVKEEPSAFAVMRNDLTIVLPVFNEEEAIPAVVDELLEYGYRNILVVDGYSTDSTVRAARLKGVTVVEQHGIGKSGAIQTAIENAKTPYVLIMDGDYTYDAASIQRFLSHANGYDQIIGTRSPENISRIHRFGNRLISRLFNALFGTHLSDVCSGMYLLNLKSARALEFHTKGFSVEVEVLAQMALNGNVTEVPINYRKRIGKPKLSTLVHGFDILKSIIGLSRRYNPVFVFSLIAGSAAFPGIVIVAWVLSSWFESGIMHSGWALAGSMLLLFAAQAFIAGTVALLLKRTELRIERLVRREEH
jgi:dolichol-phosphate mannosyltransferase